MALSYTDAVGDGIAVTFPFSFAGPDNGYFRVADIVAEVDEVITAYTLTGPTQVTFAVPPADQAKIRIRRLQPNDTPYTDFKRGNAFGQVNVNRSFLQQLFLVHEFMDGFKVTDYYEKQNLNMGTDYKLINLAPGVDPLDSVNLQQMTDTLGDNEAQAAAAAASAAAALVSENAAAASAASIVGDAAAAAASAAAALVSEGNAGDSELAAGVSEDNALASETAAGISAAAALVSEGAASTSESNAASSAGTATTQAGIATTKAGEANQSAIDAEASAQSIVGDAAAAAASALAASNSEIAAAASALAASNSEAGVAADALAASDSAAAALVSEGNALTHANTSLSHANASGVSAAAALVSEGAASTSETNALNSAAAAALSASNALTSEGNALTHANAAGVSAAAALVSENNAAQSEIDCQDIVDNFGTRAGDVTFNRTGDSGDTFLNTNTSAWIPVQHATDSGSIGGGTTPTAFTVPIGGIYTLSAVLKFNTAQADIDYLMARFVVDGVTELYVHRIPVIELNFITIPLNFIGYFALNSVIRVEFFQWGGTSCVYEGENSKYMGTLIKVL